MDTKIFNMTTDFCSGVMQQSKGRMASDEVRFYIDSESELYEQAQDFSGFDQIAFKDVYDEDYQHEFRQNYLDSKLLEIEEEGIWIHRGLEYVLFYYLTDVYRTSINDYLTMLAEEEEKKAILLHDKNYEVDKRYYRNSLDPMLSREIGEYGQMRYLLEHIAQFIYRATDFILIEKKGIEFVLDYSKRFHFEKISASLNNIE